MAGVREADVVVEFGPGTGVITRAISEGLRGDAVFFAMEINRSFVKTMRKQFPDVTIHHDSAEHTRKYLEQAGVEYCDSIVSGLPWTAFGDGLQDSLLDTVQDVLRPGGHFATYMYLHCPFVPTGKRFLAKLERRFGQVERTAIVWKNMPPAFVLWVKR